MTLVEKSHTNENYYITVEIQFGRAGPYYSVQVCPRIGDCECVYPIRDMTYCINEKKKAYATFNRYKRKYV